MAEILSIISLISFILSGVCLVLALFIWFRFRIIDVIGDLSGRTAKKSIERIREHNEKSGGQGYKPSPTNLARGKLTESIPPSSKSDGESSVNPNKSERPETGMLIENRADAEDTDATERLDDNNETTMLDEGTALLVDMPDKEPDYSESESTDSNPNIVMIDEVMLIHTDEVI